MCSCVSGLSGADDAHVFISSGEDVRLSCNIALHDCKSTTWNYNRDSSAVELFAGGRKKKNRKGHERLSLGSDCSLNIKSVTEEDCGSYFCRQYVNNQQQGTDARVYLHVLHVFSSSPSQTEISAGLSLTLFCQLYSSYPRVSCGDWIRSEGIDLFWVNQAGDKLTRSDSRYQISFSSDHCISSLTTTILNEDHNRERRCEVTQRDQLKTSVTYTVKISARSDSETAETSVHITDSTTTTSTTSTPDVRRATDDSVEQTDDVTYTEVTACSKNRSKKNKVRCDDKVTYASIRGTKAGAQENCSQLYASVNKNHHKSDK
ncbi:uncharacterized protein LOC132143576 [Carassius carassius]|uniref:uncharacterized protein LOC132143576 n=1 Tax=Carassius carassius TaxID=217509 RepID=UPI0028697D9D|nr:uncharacterized protein LOC132143576 [Carassius carassius]